MVQGERWRAGMAQESRFPRPRSNGVQRGAADSRWGGLDGTGLTLRREAGEAARRILREARGRGRKWCARSWSAAGRMKSAAPAPGPPLAGLARPAAPLASSRSQ